MKKTITSICLAVMFFMTSMVSKADTFYVLDGQSVKLTPALLTLTSYLYKFDGVDALGSEVSGGVFTKVIELTDHTKAATHTLSLSVIDGLSCVSALVTHTIIVLPKITVTVKATNDGPINFCVGTNVNASLTATISVNDLGTFGVTLAPLTWSKGGTALPSLSGSSVSVSETGVYTALTSYVIPTTLGHFASTKLADAILTVGQEIKHDLAIPGVPGITIN